MKTLTIPLICILTFSFHCAAARKISKPKFGKLEGDVQINGQRAREHHFIPPNMEIEAKGKDSSFETKLENGNLVKIVNGKIILKKEKRNVSVHLLQGRAFVKKPGKRKFRLTLKDITVEGTGKAHFMAEYRNTSYIYVKEGMVRIWDSQKNTYLVKAGQSFGVDPISEESTFSLQQADKKTIQMTQKVFGGMSF